MDTLTFLFWTLVALLAVVMFAVEAGAATRHRNVIMCTVASTLFSVLYIMFFIDDRTKFDIKPTEEVKKKKGGGGEGAASTGNRGGGKKKSGGGGAEAEEEDLDEEIDAGGDDKVAAAKADADLGLTFQDCPECPLMVRVPAGRFLMGSPASETGRKPTEGPQREVSISPDFAMSKSAITREQFAKFVSVSGYEPASSCVVEGRLSKKHNWQSPGFEQGHSHPVVCVSRADADAYMEWLETKSKKRFRLVSEAEWEYAARGGTTTAYWPGATLAAEQFNVGRTRDGTLQTHLTPSNALGLHDVNGNVSQWVLGCWMPTLAKIPGDGSPYKTNLPSECHEGITRGGNWASRPLDARTAARSVVDFASLAYNTVGIRVARELEPPAPKK